MDPFHKFPFGAQLWPPKKKARWAAGLAANPVVWWCLVHIVDEKDSFGLSYTWLLLCICARANLQAQPKAAVAQLGTWVAFHDEKLSKPPILNDLKWIFFRSIPWLHPTSWVDPGFKNMTSNQSPKQSPKSLRECPCSQDHPHAANPTSPPGETSQHRPSVEEPSIHLWFIFENKEIRQKECERNIEIING
jgi:hypothetical protein